MSEPRLAGEYITEILSSLKRNDIAPQQDDYWEDVTDILHTPCIKAFELEAFIEDGCVNVKQDGARTKAYKPNLQRYFGTTDFSVRRRRRNAR